jgi:hypothetical protein
MNQKNKSMILFALKILIPIIVVIGLFLGGINAGVITFEKQKIITGTITSTIIIDFGDGSQYSNEFTMDNSTVFDFLLRVEHEGIISIETTYWEQFGSYTVDSITYQGTKYESDANSYWAFYVNGQPGMEGADKVFVANNDIIEWRLEKF